MKRIICKNPITQQHFDRLKEAVELALGEHEDKYHSNEIYAVRSGSKKGERFLNFDDIKKEEWTKAKCEQCGYFLETLLGTFCRRTTWGLGWYNKTAYPTFEAGNIKPETPACPEFKER